VQEANFKKYNKKEPVTVWACEFTLRKAAKINHILLYNNAMNR